MLLFVFQLLSIENDPTIGPLEKEQRKRMCMTFIGSMKYRKFIHTMIVQSLECN